MKKLLLCAGLALTVTAPAYAASGNTSTTSGVAAATVITPITLTHVSSASLNFGSFTTGTGGTVVVTAAGVGSTTGDVGFVPGSTNAADQFTVHGDNLRNFSISTTSGSVANGATTIPFTTSASANAGTLGATGNASFTVGGTLSVAGTEGAGAYTGSYNATVTYN